MRDCRLQSIEAVVQRKQSVPTECNDDSFLLFAENRRTRFLQPGLSILNSRSLPPLRHRLRIDAKLSAQLRGRTLRSLYCCSESVRGRGAPLTNLSHSASFHSNERIAPSNRGIKHLGSGPIDFPGMA